MFAVVLVGGFGTRLRPLTNAVPKPLLPLGQRTILEWMMVHLARGGVTDAVLALGFKPEPFVAAFPDRTCAGVRLHFAIEDAPLDTAGAIGFAARLVGLHERTEPFVVANGDIVTDLRIADLVAAHQRHRTDGALATIHLTPVVDPSQYGVVETQPDGRVTGFVEKPAPGTTASRHVNAGTYVLEASSLDVMPGDAPLSIERVTFPYLVQQQALFALATDDYWLDAGRPDSYLRANLDLINGRRNDRDDAEHSSAVLDHECEVRDSVVGAGARIGKGARVIGSVIGPRAVIGDSAVVEGSVALGDVAASQVVRDALIAPA
ncbi:MAG: hypothetical protein RLZZ88_310 [Actinomycetota bacterium]